MILSGVSPGVQSRTPEPGVFDYRVWGAALIVFVLVAAACGGTAPSTATAPAGPPVPEIEFATFDGETTSFVAFAGAPLVVNFWASWCPSCVAEMSAALAPAQREFGDRVTFIGMNLQDDRDLAVALLEETGVEWVNGVDPDGSLYIEFGGIGMPFTIFVSPDGEILDAHNGPLSLDQLRDRIERLLLS